MNDSEIRIVLKTVRDNGAQMTAKEWDAVADSVKGANAELQKWVALERQRLEAVKREMARADQIGASQPQAYVTGVGPQANAHEVEYAKVLRLRRERAAWLAANAPPVIDPWAQPSSSVGQEPSGGGGGGGGGPSRGLLGWGARSFGLPGSGAMAGGAVLGAIGVGVTYVINRFKSWKEAIEDTVRAWGKLETFSQGLDTMAVRQQRMNQHTQQFALSLAQIERQVHTVAAQVDHYLKLEETQIAFEQRLDDARTSRMASESALRNRFNPIQHIKELEQIEEDAYKRKVERERQLEQLQLNSISLQQNLTAARGAEYSKEASALRAGLDPLQASANKAGVGRDITEKALDLSVSRYESLRIALKQLIAGQAAGGKYRDARDIVLAEGEEGKDELDKLILDPTTNASMLTGVGRVPQSVKDAAAKQLSRIGTGDENETGTRLSGIRDKRMAARARANATAFALAQQMRKLGYAEDEIQKATSEFKTSDMQMQMLQEQINQNAPLRDEAERQNIDSMRTREQLDILNAIPPANIPPAGGGARVDPDMQLNNTLLERIARALEPA